SLIQGVGPIGDDVPVLEVQAQGLTGIGVRAVGVVNGIHGEANGTASSSTGVTGNSDNGTGVNGTSTSGTGVNGHSASKIGVQGSSESNFGVFGESANGIGIKAQSLNSNALEAEVISTEGGLAIDAKSPTTAIQAQGATGVVAIGADTDGRGVVGKGAVGVQGEGPAQSQGVGVFGTGHIGVQGAGDLSVIGGPPVGTLFESGPPILVGVAGTAPGDVKHGDVPSAYGGWFDPGNGTAPLHLEPSAD